MQKRMAMVAIALLAAGCGGQDDVSDRSEGVTTFVLSAPDLSVGQLEAEEPYLLSNVSDATRLSDGSVAVANCVTAEVRWFDGQGRFVRSAGGRGQGPGEFNFLRRLFPAGGDSVGAFDPFMGRITIFAPDGGLTTIDLAPLGRAEVLGRLRNGLFVARRYRAPPTQAVSELGRSTTPLLLIDSDGDVVDSIPTLDDADFRVPGDVGRPVLGLRLGRAAVFAVLPDRIFYGAQDDAGITVFDETLSNVGVIETLTRAEAITDADKAEFQAMLDDRAHIAGTVGPAFSSSYAPMAPAFRDIIGGRDGSIWVEDPLRPGLHPLVWTSYDEGEPTRRVEIPPRFFPFEFGADWVLGVSYDSLSVERMEVRHFVRSDLPSRQLPPRDAKPPTSHRCGAWASR